MLKNAEQLLWSVSRLALGVANIKADKIVLTDLKFGVWNGVVKYVDQ